MYIVLLESENKLKTIFTNFAMILFSASGNCFKYIEFNQQLA